MFKKLQETQSFALVVPKSCLSKRKSSHRAKIFLSFLRFLCLIIYCNIMSELILHFNIVGKCNSVLGSAVSLARSSLSVARQRSRSNTVRSEGARPSNTGPPCREKAWWSCWTRWAQRPVRRVLESLSVSWNHSVQSKSFSCLDEAPLFVFFFLCNRAAALRVSGADSDKAKECLFTRLHTPRW